jgi:hypothetical protein
MAKIPTIEYLQKHVEEIPLGRVPILKHFYLIEDELVHKFLMVTPRSAFGEAEIQVVTSIYHGYKKGQSFTRPRDMMVYYIPPSKDHP